MLSPATKRLQKKPSMIPKKMSGNYLGSHLLIEFFECSIEIISNQDLIKEYLLEAARLASATIVADLFHSFNPQGISGVVVIAESHLAIHTWPEHRCASVDVFSCGTQMKTDEIEPFLKTAFCAQRTMSQAIQRGWIG
jgi:S-adenosylmethionine decarboxylase proenzyme